MEELTKNEELFILYKLQGMTQRQAYLKAFPKSQKWKIETVDAKASSLFAQDKIKARFLALSRQIREDLERDGVISAKEVLQDLCEVKNKCLGRQAVERTVQGNAVAEKVFNPKEANRALELIARHLGMFDRTHSDTEIEDFDALREDMYGSS